MANLNPLTPVIEVFRYAILGKGTFTIESVSYSVIFAFAVMTIGIVLFNNAEKDFMDTV